MSNDEIKITAQLFPDPDVCIFRVDRPVFPGGAFDCKSREMASGSLLLEKLYDLGSIREIFITGDTLTISKSSEEDWQVLGREVGRVIREVIRSGKPLMKADLIKPAPPDDEIMRIISELFDTRINPAIASHGGHVECVEVKNAVVYIRMSGGCQGCSASSATLRYGIERAIRDEIPEIAEIIDVTDTVPASSPTIANFIWQSAKERCRC